MPCVTSSRRPSKSISTFVGPENLPVSGEVFGRSQSCTELREPASGQLSRSFSMTFFHRKQKKQLVKPKNWKRSISVKNEERALDSVGPVQESELVSPPCSTLNGATAHPQEPAEITQNTHPQPAPAVQMQRSLPSLPSPRTTPSCLSNYNDNIPSAGTSAPSLSATIIAQRLKRQRKRANPAFCKY